ncbi:Threonine synthase [invertebrate metagenome]|uniref:threonine synthase n=1 Tax=invertebrate metagenome TaxID=1711999 RepID=A0A2H9TAX2_9ZZZZ
MKYISTRGHCSPKNFSQVLLKGLAGDGGLFVPDQLPEFDKKTLIRFRQLPYNELAAEILTPFTTNCIDPIQLRHIIDKSYQNFTHKSVAPLQQMDHNRWILELFHGPTLAFKDFALQLLGNLLDHELAIRNKKAIILAATSGDTGSAAIEGCRHSDYLDIVILHPEDKVSDIQRRQMTTALDTNIHNIAVKGNFDDCQSLVKQCFMDQSFLSENTQLIAVNSINWVRIMAQTVYYFYAALALGSPARDITFSVPTGNFGNVFAGYIAQRMGLPIKKLIVATNQNDILHRFFQHNDYQLYPLQHTLSPSMDIMIANNFERLLFDLLDQDGKAVNLLMQTFSQSGKINIPSTVQNRAKLLFDSAMINDQQTIETITRLHKVTGYLVDPHTATAVQALEQVHHDVDTAQVILATAHPVKFPGAIRQAHLPHPELPPRLQNLMTRTERYQKISNDLASLKHLLQNI